MTWPALMWAGGLVLVAAILILGFLAGRSAARLNDEARRADMEQGQ